MRAFSPSGSSTTTTMMFVAASLIACVGMAGCSDARNFFDSPPYRPLPGMDEYLTIHTFTSASCENRSFTLRGFANSSVEAVSARKILGENRSMPQKDAIPTKENPHEVTLQSDPYTLGEVNRFIISVSFKEEGTDMRRTKVIASVEGKIDC